MGIGSFFKALVNPEASGELMISSLEKQYQIMTKAMPDKNPYVHLTEIYSIRRSGFRNLKGIEREALFAEATQAAMLHACLPPPKNIRALALFLLFKEREDIMRSCPKFLIEYSELMEPVHAAESKGTRHNLFKKYNPKVE